MEMQRVWIRDAHDAHAVIVRFLPVQRTNRCDQRGRRAGPNQNGRYAVCHTEFPEVILEVWAGCAD